MGKLGVAAQVVVFSQSQIRSEMEPIAAANDDNVVQLRCSRRQFANAPNDTGITASNEHIDLVENQNRKLIGRVEMMTHLWRPFSCRRAQCSFRLQAELVGQIGAERFEVALALEAVLIDDA